MNSYFLRVRYTIAVAVAVIFKPNGTLTVILAEKVTLLALVASSYKFLQSELLEIMTEIVEEIADAWIIAIAQHHFVFKVLFIVL